ncbi:MAG TPA: helix-turn-helix domain-containing protein [Methanoregula sp.]|nr:helix-turn-helix domain-containing protein [Methanoregula sp.]
MVSESTRVTTVWAVIEKNARLLTGFGLSYNQARVYLAASGLGTPGIEKIAQVSGVRREDVYRILPSLSRMGIIERLVTKPVTIRTLPPEKAISLLIRNLEESTAKEFEELNEKAEVFFKNWSGVSLHEDFSDGEDQFSIITGRNTIVDRGAQMADNAEHEIWILSPAQSPFLSLAMVARLADAMERGVTIHLTTEPGSKALLTGLNKKDPGTGGVFDIRYIDNVHSDYIVADTRGALMMTSEGLYREQSSLWTQNRNLITLLLENYQNPGRPEGKNTGMAATTG